MMEPLDCPDNKSVTQKVINLVVLLMGSNLSMLGCLIFSGGSLGVVKQTILMGILNLLFVGCH